MSSSASAIAVCNARHYDVVAIEQWTGPRDIDAIRIPSDEEQPKVQLVFADNRVYWFPEILSNMAEAIRHSLSKPTQIFLRLTACEQAKARVPPPLRSF